MGVCRLECSLFILHPCTDRWNVMSAGHCWLSLCGTLFYWISGSASFVPLSLRWPVGLLINGPLRCCVQGAADKGAPHSDQAVDLPAHCPSTRTSAKQGKQMANKRRSFGAELPLWGGCSWDMTAVPQTLPQTLPGLCFGSLISLQNSSQEAADASCCLSASTHKFH